ncbi:MAG: hypothetical protein OXT67_09755 [Zetaproteobacteria bacterium]|nr:hypothetical protein [Zetaproteobacteria bacterium]
MDELITTGFDDPISEFQEKAQALPTRKFLLSRPCSVNDRSRKAPVKAKKSGQIATANALTELKGEL